MQFLMELLGVGLAAILMFMTLRVCSPHIKSVAMTGGMYPLNIETVKLFLMLMGSMSVGLTVCYGKAYLTDATFLTLVIMHMWLYVTRRDMKKSRSLIITAKCKEM